MASIFIDKWKAQLKAAKSDYDIPHSVSSESPIVFEDGDNVKLSFAVIADTHLPDNEIASNNLACMFEDIRNSKEKFDAVIVAGDIAEFGKIAEYKRFFDVFDRQKLFKYVLLTVGNHDVRFLFKRNQKIISEKTSEYLGRNLNGKAFYSCDINGYKFIVIGTEKRVLEKAYISKTQLEFLESELECSAGDNKPTFVVCHQPLKNTHGLPEVWRTGDIGKQSDEVRSILEKYENVIFINGHLHGGIYEKTFEVLNEENNVYSLSVPSYRKENNFGIKDSGVGFYCEVYSEKTVFTVRNFMTGKNISEDKIEIINKYR